MVAADDTIAHLPDGPVHTHQSTPVGAYIPAEPALGPVWSLTELAQKIECTSEQILSNQMHYDNENIKKIKRILTTDQGWFSHHDMPCPSGLAIGGVPIPAARGQLKSYMESPAVWFKIRMAYDVEPKFRVQISTAHRLLAYCIGSDFAVPELIRKNAIVFDNLIGFHDTGGLGTLELQQEMDRATAMEALQVLRLIVNENENESLQPVAMQQPVACNEGSVHEKCTAPGTIASSRQITHPLACTVVPDPVVALESHKCVTPAPFCSIAEVQGVQYHTQAMMDLNAMD